MADRWCNIKQRMYEKRYSLYGLAAGGTFFLMLWLLTKLLQGSVCPIYRLFGIRCPGCGMTRGVIAILSGNLQKALAFHVLSVPVFVGITLYVLFLFLDILCGTCLVEWVQAVFSKKRMYPIYAILFILSYALNAGQNF